MKALILLVFFAIGYSYLLFENNESSLNVKKLDRVTNKAIKSEEQSPLRKDSGKIVVFKNDWTSGTSIQESTKAVTETPVSKVSPDTFMKDTQTVDISLSAENPLPSHPDEFGNNIESYQIEESSIGEFIPADTPETLASIENYSTLNLNSNIRIDSFIESPIVPIKAMELEPNSIGDYIPIDERGYTEVVEEVREVGEFIPVNSEGY